VREGLNASDWLAAKGFAVALLVRVVAVGGDATPDPQARTHSSDSGVAISQCKVLGGNNGGRR
jgi:hypothetical protein